MRKEPHVSRDLRNVRARPRAFDFPFSVGLTVEIGILYRGIHGNLPGWNWHPLKSDLAGHWAVSVSGNWRLTFSFKGSDAILVDYQDYH